GGTSGCEAQRDEISRCRSAGRSGDRGDPVLLRLPTRALAVPANEQPLGTHSAGSTAKNQSRGSLSGWEVGIDARGGKVASCSRHEVGHASLSGHESDGGSE